MTYCGGVEAFFGAIAVIVIVGGVIWFISMANRSEKAQKDVDDKYCLYEEVLVDKHAGKKGVDLNKAYVAKNLKEDKSIRAEIEKQILEDLKKDHKSKGD